MSDELKPCPFCGGEAIVEPWKDNFQIVHDASPTCFLGGQSDYVWTRKADAIREWNTRKEPT